jgi:hypothetical protein
MNDYSTRYNKVSAKISAKALSACKNSIQSTKEHINTNKLRKPRGSRGVTSPGVADERVRPSSPLKCYILALKFSMNKPSTHSSRNKKCIILQKEQHSLYPLLHG